MRRLCPLQVRGPRLRALGHGRGRAARRSSSGLRRGAPRRLLRRREPVHDGRPAHQHLRRPRHPDGHRELAARIRVGRGRRPLPVPPTHHGRCRSRLHRRAPPVPRRDRLDRHAPGDRGSIHRRRIHRRALGGFSTGQCPCIDPLTKGASHVRSEDRLRHQAHQDDRPRRLFLLTRAGASTPSHERSESCPFRRSPTPPSAPR
jgi:hypothetical protein